MSGNGLLIRIAGLGRFLPERILSNDELSLSVETSDEWISTRTGIRNRRIADARMCTSDMAARAAQDALANSGVSLHDIDLIIVATMSPDRPTPATATLTQHQLGLKGVPAFDISAACSGFVYGLQIACGMLQTGTYRNALLIGAEKMSSIVDWTDRTTCVLFGDAAAAVVLSRTCTEGLRPVDTLLRSDGSCTEWLLVPAGGSIQPASAETVQAGGHFIRMNGKEIFKNAVREMGAVVEELIARNHLTANDIACIIPHQANSRIIEALIKHLGIPAAKVFNNIAHYGNTSAASVPLALYEALQEKRIRKGDWIVTVAFGAGLTWGANLLKWD